jgi:hypothetical protein
LTPHLFSHFLPKYTLFPDKVTNVKTRFSHRRHRFPKNFSGISRKRPIFVPKRCITNHANHLHQSFCCCLSRKSLQTNDSLLSRVQHSDDVIPYPNQPPPPAPPSISKMEIYSDPSVFSDIDQVAINVCRILSLLHATSDLINLLSPELNENRSREKTSRHSPISSAS